MSLEGAADEGRYRTLVELRDTLCRAIDQTESARDLAALSRQLTDVLAQIDELAKSQPKRSKDVLSLVSGRRSQRAKKAAG